MNDSGFEIDGAVRLYRKTFPASAGSGSIRIDELKTFSVETIREIQGGAQQIQQASFINQNFYTLVFINMIIIADLTIKFQVVHQS